MKVLLIAVTVFCIIVSLIERQARQQETMFRMINDVEGIAHFDPVKMNSQALILSWWFRITNRPQYPGLLTSLSVQQSWRWHSEGKTGRIFNDADCITLMSATHLKSLKLDATDITDDGLLAISHISSLESLVIHRSAISDAGIAALPQLTNLKHLVFSGIDVTELPYEKMKAAFSNQKVEFGFDYYLDTIASQAGEGCELIGPNRMEAISQLIAADEQTAARKVIAAGAFLVINQSGHIDTVVGNSPRFSDQEMGLLHCFPQLRQLSIKGTTVTDNGIIKYLQNLPSLQSLEIREVGIGDAALPAIFACPTLTTVSISLNTTHLTTDSLLNFKRAYPEIRIQID